MTQAKPPEQGERLSKRVAQMVPCSRKEAEQYIEGGWVRVDGVVVETPQHRVHQQTITMDPGASLLDLVPVTLLLNKAAGVRCVQALPERTRHWNGDASGTRVLARHFSKLDNLVPLEDGASGLMVFSQDWRVVRKLQEDSAVLEHELLVEVAGEVAPEALDPMQRALKDERRPLPLAKVSINSNTPERSRLRLAVKGCHPGLAAHLCALAGLEITGLRRVRLGRVALGELPAGQWRYLAGHERF